MDRCEACGYVYDEVAVTDVPGRLRGLVGAYATALRGAREHGVERHRPAPAVWSALEYACHVRDMLRVQHDRLRLALAEHRPAFTPMGRDQRAITDRYNEQDVEVVVDELGEAAGTFADALAGLDDAGWDRTGFYNWPEPAERSMRWIARHTLHEMVHHLDDVEAGVAWLRQNTR